MRGKAWGPKAPDEPAPAAARPAVLRGFDETDIIPFGGTLENLRTDAGVTVPLTYVPPFPVYPPETAWMRQPKTEIPGLVLHTFGSGRVAYMPADLDRRYAHGNLPDHGNLLANLVRWAAGDRIGFELHGAGLIDCHLYGQPGRLVIHLVNLSNEAAWRGPMDEYIPVGPLRLRVRLPRGIAGATAVCLVSGARSATAVQQGWATLTVPRIADHEVLVIS
jgi:hypothetical protein